MWSPVYPAVMCVFSDYVIMFFFMLISLTENGCAVYNAWTTLRGCYSIQKLALDKKSCRSSHGRTEIHLETEKLIGV